MNEIKILHNMSIDNQLAVTAALLYLNSIREPMRDEGSDYTHIQHCPNT